MTNSNRTVAGLRAMLASASATGAIAAILVAAPAAAAPGLPIVSACTGASLPPSRLTTVLTPLVTGILTPLTGIPVVGPTLLAGVTGIVTGATSGAPIGLDVLTTTGAVLTPGSACNQQANGFTLATDKGITIGGNSIDGLGATGLNANAGEVGSIALGNAAVTDAAATSSIALGANAQVTAAGVGAVAIGNGATATTAGGVALGRGSVDRAAIATGGVTLGGTAYTFAGVTPTSVVSVGTPGAERQIVNVAAGQVTAASTDAVNGSQLFATNSAVGTNSAAIATNTTNITANTTAILSLNSGTAGTVQRNPSVPNGLALTAPGGTGAAPGTPQVLGNVAAGVAPTDAVNLGQVGSLVGASAAAAPIQYSNAAAPTTPTPGVASNSTTLVGAAAGPVALHNVAAGTVAAGSTDAVNGDQLNTTNGNVTANTTNLANLTTGLNGGTVGLVQQTGGAPGAGQITVGAATGGTSVSIAGTAGDRTLSGVAPGVATDDAVNLGQLNGSVGAATANAVQYDIAAGVRTNSVTFVGGGAGPVALHNVAPGVVAAGSTDAVNGDQLNTTNAAVAGNTSSIGANTTAITNLSLGINNGTLGLVQQTGGSPGAGTITVGATTAGTVVDFTGTGGTRTLSGVTAGVATTDAVNVGQLNASVGAATANAVQYDTAAKTLVTLGGVGAATPTTLTNVAAGALTPTSTDAVNGSQLAATNANVTTNTTNIAGNTTAITNLNAGTTGTVQRNPAAANGLVLTAAGGTGAAPGTPQTLGNVAAGVAATDAVNLGQVGTLIGSSAGAAPIQYSNAAAPTTPTPGVASNDTTLVGAAAGPVALHNVAAGVVATGSTDAVNGGQLASTNASVATNTTTIAGNTTAITNLTNGTAGLVQQTGGAPGAGQITVGAATGGTSVSIAGTDGNRTLTGLAAGVAGTDAVNVAQVNGLTGGGLNNVQYDPAADGGRSNTITLAGEAPGTVRITNVGGGTVAAGSTDAVNGGQLAATNASVASLVGGTAGAFQSNNAAAAAAPVASGANAAAGGFGASATGAGGLALGNGATSTGTGSIALGQGSTDGGASRVVSVGGVGSERRITNVAPALNGTDAVNLSQLQTATNSFTTTANGLQNQLNQTNFDLNQVRRRANGGTAGAMAVAGLPQAFEPGKSMIGGAFGFWQDQVAFAIGVSSIIGDQTVVKVGGSVSGQGVGGFNAGVGFQF